MKIIHFFFWGRGVNGASLKSPPINKTPLLFLILFIGFAGLPVTTFAAQVITVNTIADENDYTTTSGNCSLREAIRVAKNTGGDATDCPIVGSSGDYEVHIPTAYSPLTLSSEIEITGGTFSIIGQGTTADDVIVQAATTKPTSNNSQRVFKISGGATIKIEKLTVRYGSDSIGGGINNTGATLTLENAKVIDNYAGNHGGGIYNLSSAVLNVNNSTIANNFANKNGGGIRNSASTVNISNNTQITGNVSTLCGGGVASNNANVTVMSSNLTANLYKSLPNDLVANIIIANPAVVSTDSTITAAYADCKMSALAQIDGYAKANNAEPLTIEELKDALTDDSPVEDDNLSGYQEKVEEAPNIPDEATLIALVGEVNNGVTALNNYITDHVANPLTDTELKAELAKAGIKNVVDANLDAYRTALEDGGADGDTVAKLQAIVDNTNLQKIKDFAGGSGDLAIEQLTGTDKLTGVRPDLLEKYKEAIQAAGSGGITDWAALQTIIDQVNAANPTSSSSSNTTNTNTPIAAIPAPQPDYYQLYVASPNGHVTGDKTDIEGKSIDCNQGNGQCTGLFKRGQVVTLTTKAPTGLLFDSWGGSTDCEDGKVVMNNTRRCIAHFYGDPNYVPPEDNTNSNAGNTDSGNSNTDSTGSPINTTTNAYVDSFSIRAKIQGKNTCYQDTPKDPNNVIVAGFILAGDGTENVLIHGLNLEQNVNPKLIVRQTVLDNNGILQGVPIAKNDAWELAPRAIEIPAPYKPETQTDAALLLNLNPGVYTVTMCMSPNSKINEGIGIVTITLLDNKLTLSNVSGRGYVSGGANDAITGFVIYGNNGRKTARIKSYALDQAAMIDSAIEIGRIYFDPQLNQITGSRLNNVSSWRNESSVNNLPLENELADTDAATSMSFEPGSYTTILSSENGTQGLGLISIEFID